MFLWTRKCTYTLILALAMWWFSTESLKSNKLLGWILCSCLKVILLHIRKIIDKFIRRGNSIGTAFQSHKRTSNLKWWKWSLSCMKIKIWMCCMLQNSFHTSIYNKSRLEAKNLIEGIKMIQTYQWSICSSNSIEANPSFRV